MPLQPRQYRKAAAHALALLRQSAHEPDVLDCVATSPALLGLFHNVAFERQRAVHTSANA